MEHTCFADLCFALREDDEVVLFAFVLALLWGFWDDNVKLSTLRGGERWRVLGVKA